jgi:hypothetical protein
MSLHFRPNERFLMIVLVFVLGLLVWSGSALEMSFWFRRFPPHRARMRLNLGLHGAEWRKADLGHSP